MDYRNGEGEKFQCLFWKDIQYAFSWNDKGRISYLNTVLNKGMCNPTPWVRNPVYVRDIDALNFVSICGVPNTEFMDSTRLRFLFVPLIFQTNESLEQGELQKDGKGGRVISIWQGKGKYLCLVVL